MTLRRRSSSIDHHRRGRLTWRDRRCFLDKRRIITTPLYRATTAPGVPVGRRCYAVSYTSRSARCNQFIEKYMDQQVNLMIPIGLRSVMEKRIMAGGVLVSSTAHLLTPGGRGGRCSSYPTRAMCFVTVGHVGTVERQLDVERRPFPDDAIEFDLTTEFTDDLLGGGQPQAGAPVSLR